MQGLGDRLRQRARELGLTDSEVARRLGLSQARYANYVADKREPDYRTLLDICRILSLSPDDLFGVSPRTEARGFSEAPPQPSIIGAPGLKAPGPDEGDRLRERIGAAAAAMSLPTLRIAAALADTLVRVQNDD